MNYKAKHLRDISLSHLKCGRPIRILVWKNEDFYGDGQEITLNPFYLKTWNAVLCYLTATIEGNLEAIRKLVHLKTRKVIRCLEHLEPMEKYIAVGTKRFKTRKKAYRTQAEKNHWKIKKQRQLSDDSLETNLFLKVTKRNRRTVIYMMVSGRTCQLPVKVVLTVMDYLNWNVVVKYLEKMLDVVEGIKHITDINGNKIEDPHQLKHGGYYIAVPFGDRFVRRDYTPIFDDYTGKLTQYDEIIQDDAMLGKKGSLTTRSASQSLKSSLASLPTGRGTMQSLGSLRSGRGTTQSFGSLRSGQSAQSCVGKVCGITCVCPNSLLARNKQDIASKSSILQAVASSDKGARDVDISSLVQSLLEDMVRVSVDEGEAEEKRGFRETESIFSKKSVSFLPANFQTGSSEASEIAMKRSTSSSSSSILNEDSRQSRGLRMTRDSIFLPRFQSLKLSKSIEPFQNLDRDSLEEFIIRKSNSELPTIDEDNSDVPSSKASIYKNYERRSFGSRLDREDSSARHASSIYETPPKKKSAPILKTTSLGVNPSVPDCCAQKQYIPEPPKKVSLPKLQASCCEGMNQNNLEDSLARLASYIYETPPKKISVPILKTSSVAINPSVLDCCAQKQDIPQLPKKVSLPKLQQSCCEGVNQNTTDFSPVTRPSYNEYRISEPKLKTSCCAGVNQNKVETSSATYASYNENPIDQIDDEDDIDYSLSGSVTAGIMKKSSACCSGKHQNVKEYIPIIPPQARAPCCEEKTATDTSNYVSPIVKNVEKDEEDLSEELESSESSEKSNNSYVNRERRDSNQSSESSKKSESTKSSTDNAEEDLKQSSESNKKSENSESRIDSAEKDLKQSSESSILLESKKLNIDNAEKDLKRSSESSKKSESTKSSIDSVEKGSKRSSESSRKSETSKLSIDNGEKGSNRSSESSRKSETSKLSINAERGSNRSSESSRKSKTPKLSIDNAEKGSNRSSVSSRKSETPKSSMDSVGKGSTRSSESSKKSDEAGIDKSTSNDSASKNKSKHSHTNIDDGNKNGIENEDDRKPKRFSKIFCGAVEGDAETDDLCKEGCSSYEQLEGGTSKTPCCRENCLSFACSEIALKNRKM
ncbi:uncharacterized protein LOC115885109 isoform X2 [Sitophilus oryzae]|uniref:Uncharacterized protein LOC115885109 isoform X2 n=1 Tax=Sitophilus oryzae TaxID=7048 RepID=A0A6J2Y9A6_SITOR|nr:uncharacterized protein LOC115885109 isoform X2 [Sitophilus oryzae]